MASQAIGFLQVGAQFLALHYPLKLIYIPSPTWANHNKIFPLAGIEIRNYRYYKPSTRGLDYEVSCAFCLSTAATRTAKLCKCCVHEAMQSKLGFEQTVTPPLDNGHAAAVFAPWFVIQLQG